MIELPTLRVVENKVYADGLNVGGLDGLRDYHVAEIAHRCNTWPELVEALEAVERWGITVMGELPAGAEDGLAKLSHIVSDAIAKAKGTE